MRGRSHVAGSGEMEGAGLWSHGYAKPRRWAARCPAILDPGMTGLIRLASHSLWLE